MAVICILMWLHFIIRCGVVEYFFFFLLQILFPAIPLKYLSAFSFDGIHQKTTESS